jgi:hypothetical protein
LGSKDFDFMSDTLDRSVQNRKREISGCEGHFKRHQQGLPTPWDTGALVRRHDIAGAGAGALPWIGFGKPTTPQTPTQPRPLRRVRPGGLRHIGPRGDGHRGELLDLHVFVIGELRRPSVAIVLGGPHLGQHLAGHLDQPPSSDPGGVLVRHRSRACC